VARGAGGAAGFFFGSRLAPCWRCPGATRGGCRFPKKDLRSRPKLPKTVPPLTTQKTAKVEPTVFGSLRTNCTKPGRAAATQARVSAAKTGSSWFLIPGFQSASFRSESESEAGARSPASETPPSASDAETQLERLSTLTRPLHRPIGAVLRAPACAGTFLQVYGALHIPSHSALCALNPPVVPCSPYSFAAAPQPSVSHCTT
jgi:hypothetical protein